MVKITVRTAFLLLDIKSHSLFSFITLKGDNVHQVVWRHVHLFILPVEPRAVQHVLRIPNQIHHTTNLLRSVGLGGFTHPGQLLEVPAEGVLHGVDHHVHLLHHGLTGLDSLVPHIHCGYNLRIENI